jgi:hypothetical protein
MYKVTAINQFKAMRFHLMGTIFMLITLYFLGFNSDAEVIFISAWIIYTLPALYLHLEYYFHDKGKTIEISSSEIIITDGDCFKLTYQNSQVEKIIVYKSASLDKGGIQFTAIETYHYARIFIEGGEEIVITCLMAPDVDKTVRELHGVSYERKKRFFCSLSMR